jgi:hypothetical protein
MRFDIGSMIKGETIGFTYTQNQNQLSRRN